MNLIWSLCLLASWVSVLVSAEVLVLTQDNFEESLKTHPNLLVDFYAPWCGHCKRLEPEWDKAAADLKGVVALGKVDATVETDLASRFEIRGYPTIKFFHNGAPQEYKGGRTAAEIVSWGKKKTGPPSHELEEAQVADFVASKAVVVGRFAGSRDSAAYKAFIAAAADPALSDFEFADVAGASADSVTVHRATGESFKKEGDVKLSDFVLDKGYPIVDEIPKAWDRVSKRGLPLAVLFLDPAADNSAHMAALTEAASDADVRSAISFVHADGVRFKQQLDRMGLSSDANLPQLASMSLNGKKNYPYNGAYTASELKAWALGIADGSIAPHRKSEAVPASNSGHVVTVVGSNFDEVVLNPEKDVLLEIYAPWCGHCKSLQPIYEQLGEAYAKHPSVVIAKVDATANDIDVPFEGFPTIVYYKKGADKSVTDFITYEGDRSLADLSKWVQARLANAAGNVHKDHHHSHEEDL